MSKKSSYRRNKKAHLQSVFALRKAILSAGLIAAFGVYGLTLFWKNTFLLSIAAYIGTVTLGEIGVWISQIKSWRFFGSLDFLSSRREKPHPFEGYIKSCRYIRLTSLLVALSASLIGYFFECPLESFVGTYISATLLGSIVVRAFSNVVFPPFLERRELRPEERVHGVSMNEALALGYGLTGKYGNPYDSGRCIR